jgi:hypothetical protein
MVYNNLNYKPGSFKVITLVLKGFYNHKQLPIIGTIVSLSPSEFPGLEYY